jgi:hypothetical protein
MAVGITPSVIFSGQLRWITQQSTDLLHWRQMIWTAFGLAHSVLSVADCATDCSIV